MRLMCYLIALLSGLVAAVAAFLILAAMVFKLIAPPAEQMTVYVIFMLCLVPLISIGALYILTRLNRHDKGQTIIFSLTFGAFGGVIFALGAICSIMQFLAFIYD